MKEYPTILCTAVLLGALVSFGCSPDSARTGTTGPGGLGPGNRPPSIRSAHIVPTPVVLNGPVTVRIDAEDPDRDPVTFRFQWLLNGKPVPGQTSNQFPVDLLKRGDQITVEVIPFDGKTEGAPYRPEPVLVENTAPVLTSVTIAPAQARAGESLRAVVDGSDADRDEVRYTFKWWRNGTLFLEGEEATLDTTTFVRGDSIVVSATPRDAVAQGKEAFSQPITLINSPPKIISVPPSVVESGRYEYMVKAVDPEGDPVTFTLQTSPPGMRIDGRTGRIEWQVPPEFKGPCHVKVMAQDDREDWAFQEFDLIFS